MAISSKYSAIPPDYSERIKRYRARCALTQAELAGRMGVSFTTVNRWENGQTKPSRVFWQQLIRLDEEEPADAAPKADTASVAPSLDFTASPDAVLSLAEGERLSFGHMFNPGFAAEISQIDPLPHQRIAVYDHMLNRFPLRFLLADDAGAGKTIMSGLYVREMMARRLIPNPSSPASGWRRGTSSRRRCKTSPTRSPPWWSSRPRGISP